MSKSGGAQKLVFLISGALIGFVAAYAATYESETKKPGPVEVAQTDGKAVVVVDPKPVRTLEESPFKGTEKPKVLIHEVSEFQWPFCAKVGPTIQQILTTYGDDVQIKFLHNPLSFHKDAMGAAQASMAAARQGRFWDYHDTLFANMKSLDDANLVQFAKELGLNVEQFEKDRKDKKIQERIDADQTAVVKLGAKGTPAFFVNGIHVKGAKPFPEFKKIIDAELEKVNAKIAGGVAADNAVYAVFKENNKEAFDLLVRLLPVRKPPPPPPEVWKVSLRGNEAAKGGGVDAPVTIVEWSDFECPFCSKVGPTINQVLDEYKDDVRFIFKHNPLSFHKKALLAAEASIEAQVQGKFWEYHDKLFENQKALERENLEAYAEELGLDMVKFRTALDERTHKDRALAEQGDAGDVKASGTPAFFVNGRKLKGNSFEDFKGLIDVELKEAKKLVAAGTAPKDVYGKRIATGKIHKVLDSKVNSFTTTGSPVIGKTPAKITITEFSEFQWPYCSRVGPALKPLKDIYGDDLAIVFKHYPLNFHKDAMPAALASLAAGEQGLFWEYHDILFENQKALQADKLAMYAEQIGLDMEKWRVDKERQSLKDLVARDMREGSKAGVRGTPSVFINGRRFQPTGGYTVEGFKAAIDKEILKK